MARTALKRSAHSLFSASQWLGANVLPLHFYSPIPDLHDLRARTDWKPPRSMLGIQQLDVNEQLALLGRWLNAGDEHWRRSVYRQAIAANDDAGYGPIEAQVLAAYIAASRPSRIVQIGCGVSTRIILAAADRAGYQPRIVCIDPYPTEYLRRIVGEGGRITLHDEPAQAIDLSVLTDLTVGDLLFVDSTHTVKPGSEVNRIILEVLPRLAQGVWVHFHDIYFPYDYARDLLSGDLFFPGETTLLYAFLLNNPTYRIELGLSLLHYAAPEQLKALLPDYEPQGNDAGLAASGGQHFPSALYLLHR